MYLFLFFKDMLFLLGLIFSCFLLAGKCTSSSLLDNLQPPQQPPRQPPLAPALYVFGDSLFDSGNNNWLPTLAKANYPPYGLSFPKGPTGRFTNGKTVADFIGMYFLNLFIFFFWCIELNFMMHHICMHNVCVCFADLLVADWHNYFFHILSTQV